MLTRTASSCRMFRSPDASCFAATREVRCLALYIIPVRYACFCKYINLLSTRKNFVATHDYIAILILLSRAPIQNPQGRRTSRLMPTASTPHRLARTDLWLPPWKGY